MDDIVIDTKEEAIEYFKPSFRVCVTEWFEIIVRVIIALGLSHYGVLLWGEQMNGENFAIALTAVFATETLFHGLKFFSYIEDIVIHILAISIFLLFLALTKSPLLSLAGMSIMNSWTKMEFSYLLGINEINDEVLIEWKFHYDRMFKVQYVMLGIVVLFITKNLGLL